MRVWGRRSEIDTLKAWIAAANARDYPAMAAVMADDFTIIDSSGDELSGRDACAALLANLFERAPDHRIEVDSFTRRGDEVLMTGLTSATNPQHATSTHFVARANHEHVLRWQSFSASPTHTLQHFKPQQQSQSAA